MNNNLTIDEAEMLLNLLSQTSIPANIPNRMELMGRVDSTINKLTAMIPEPDVLELPEDQAKAA